MKKENMEETFKLKNKNGTDEKAVPVQTETKLLVVR